MIGTLEPYHYALLPVLGVAVGTFGATFGLGGGFVLVPILLVLFPEADPVAITGISLTVVLLNAASAGVVFLRRRRVDRRTGLLIAGAAVPAAVGGALVTQAVSRDAFELAFGAVMLGGAVYLVWRARHLVPLLAAARSPNRDIEDVAGAHYVYRVEEPVLWLISPVAGFVSSFFGIGGGIIHVPVMVLVLHVPAVIAVGTSQLVLVATAATAIAVQLATGAFAPTGVHALLVGAGTVIGAQAGARLARRISGPAVLIGISVALFVAGVRTLIGGLGG